MTHQVPRNNVLPIGKRIIAENTTREFPARDIQRSDAEVPLATVGIQDGAAGTLYRDLLKAALEP
jgi:hypothetical protein